MSKFISRVELNNATLNEFSLFHDTMSDLGFSQELPIENGDIYRLPRATYRIVKDVVIRDILNLIKQALKTINKTAEIFVVKYTDSDWDGLDLKE